MGARDVIFTILAIDEASKTLERTGLAAEGAGSKFGKFGNLASKALVGVGLGAAAAAIEGVKMAAEFQTSLSLLATGAGESRANLDTVGKGILGMAGNVGIGANELAKAMYLVESAGYHGAAGLKVLQAAAEGAKTDGADVTEVGNALTTVLNDMHAPAASAAAVMSQMVAAVGQGKMRMNDLAGSIHSVLPNASALGLSFAQTAGALATMTAQGIGADQAAQNLNHTIVKLAAPTAGMTAAMARYGLSAQDVAKNLGKEGLTGTLDEVVTAITSHMGPAGLTLINTFNQSKAAAQDAAIAMQALPPAARDLAEGYAHGSVSVGDFRKELKSLPADQGALIMQWKAMEDRAHGFSDSLKSGTPAAQTFTAALKSMLGDQTALQVALHLTGEHAAEFSAAVKKIAGTTADAGGHVKDFAETQKNLTQKWADAKASLNTLLIELGQKLIPVLSTLLTLAMQVGPAIKGAFDNRWLAGSVTILAAGAAAWKAYTLAEMAWMTTTKGAAVVMGLWTLLLEKATVQQGLAAMEGITLSRVQAIMTVAQIELDAAMDANPIGLIVVAIAALAAGLIYAYKNSETFRNIVNATFGAVKGVVVAAVNAIKTAWDAFVGGFQNPAATIGQSVGTVTAIFLTLGAAVGRVVGWFTAIPGEIAGAWATATGAWATATGVLQTGLSAVVGWFQALPGRILAGIEAFPQAFSQFCLTLLEKAAFAVGFGLGMLVNLFFVWPSKVSAAIASLPGIVLHWITTTGVQALTSFASFVVSFVESAARLVVRAGAAVASLPGVIAHWITTTGVQSLIAFYNFQVNLIARAYDLTGQMVAWVAALVSRVVAWFARLPGMVIDELKVLPGQIKAVFDGAKTWLVDAGKAIVHGLIDGIKSMASGLLNLAKDLAGQVASGFKSALGISSPSKVMAEEVGRWIPAGIAQGMYAGAHHIATAAAAIVPPGRGAYGGGTSGPIASSAGGGGVTNIHLHVPNGFVGSPDQLATALSDVISRAKARGLNLSFA